MRELGLVPCQPRPRRFSLTEQRPGTAARPRRPRLHRRRARQEARRRHHLHPDRGRLAVSRDGHRLPHEEGHRLRDGRPLPNSAHPGPLCRTRHGTSPLGPTRSSTPIAAVTTRPTSSPRPSRELGLRQSVGRTGICYDNAMAESFFGALKNERVHRTVYPTRAHARAGHHSVHRILVQPQTTPLGSGTTNLPKKPSTSGQKARLWRRLIKLARSENRGADQGDPAYRSRRGQPSPRPGPVPPPPGRGAAPMRKACPPCGRCCPAPTPRPAGRCSPAWPAAWALRTPVPWTNAALICWST